VLELGGYAGAWPTGLDPATNVNGAADQDQMNSIFGQLFQLAEGGKVIPADPGARAAGCDRRGGRTEPPSAGACRWAIAWRVEILRPCRACDYRLTGRYMSCPNREARTA